MIKKKEAITPKRCAELIKANFKEDDYIIIYDEETEQPYHDGFCIDRAKYAAQNLIDGAVLDQDALYHFVVGKVVINTYRDYFIGD